MTTKQEYYSVREVSEILGLSLQTVKSWIYQTKTLPAVKIGGAVRIHQSEINKLIKPIK